MIERIVENEEMLDEVMDNIKKLDIEINRFKNNKKNIKLLNKYYGSKEWFKDKEMVENKKINNVKAGVLSEDMVWNMLDDMKDILKDMKDIVKEYERNGIKL